MGLLEDYLSSEEIEQLIEFEPEILDLDKFEIENHILALKDKNIKPETIKTCLLSNPQFLLSNVYDIGELLDFIESHSDDLDNILEEFPEILKYTKEDLIETIYDDSNRDIDIERIIAEFILSR